MRACPRCGKECGPEDFYEGLRHACKDCIRAAAHARRLLNPAVQEYDRERAKRPEVAARLRKIADDWRKENPAAYRAHTAVGNAIRDGKLQRGPCCELCGKKGRLHAHHRDYEKPFDVVWLCPSCHHRLHALFPELSATKGSTENA